MPPDEVGAPEAEVSTQAPAAEQQISTPDSVETDVYDEAFSEFLDDSVSQEEAVVDEPQAQQPTNETAVPAADSPLTQGDLAVFARAKLNPDAFATWERPQLDAFVGQLRAMQSDQDTLGAELARFKSAQPPAQEKTPEAKPQEQRNEFADRVKATFEKLTESYDVEIRPLADLFETLYAENQRVSQAARAIEPISNLLTELLIDQAITGVASKYPSATSQEGRSKIVERFWTEWNTGAYAKPGVSVRDQISGAMSNAAKVTFTDVSEASAAAQLIKNNRDRVAGQPKVGSRANAAKAQPITMEDVYDNAFAETIGKELGARR